MGDKKMEMTREEAIKQCEGFIKNHSDWSVEVEWAKGMEFVLEDYKRLIEQEPCDDWCDVPSDEMTLGQARQAVKDLRKKLAEYLEQEPTTKNDLGVDCISRVKVIDYLCKHCPDDGECFEDCDEIKHLRQMPSVTPQPRKGHWEHGRELSRIFMGNVLKGIDYEDWHCSNCHCVVEQSIKPEWNYCPNCGADMREVEE